MQNIFYVYVHRRATDDKVFYVGKGKGRRAYTKGSRNKYWHHTAKKHGYYVQIIKQSLQEQEAFELEEGMISAYGIKNLTNQTLGGISTTGYKHTEDDLQKMREIAKKRLEDNPELLECINNNLSKLHNLQKNDIEYKKKMSEWSKNHWNSLTDEEKTELNRRKLAGFTPEIRAQQSETMRKLYADNPDKIINLSERTSKWWADLSPEDYEMRRKMHSDVLNDPINRQTLLDKVQIKVVINRKRVLNSMKSLNEFFDSTAVANSLKNATRKGYIGTLYKGYFLEYYNESIHGSVMQDEPIIAYPFLSLPLSFAVVRDEKQLFLSVYEAARVMGREGKKVGTTGDWLSVKARNNDTSYGSTWRVATTQEVNNHLESIFGENNNE